MVNAIGLVVLAVATVISLARLRELQQRVALLELTPSSSPKVTRDRIVLFHLAVEPTGLVGDESAQPGGENNARSGAARPKSSSGALPFVGLLDTARATEPRNGSSGESDV